MHLCNRKSARTKTIVVVKLIIHKQLQEQFTQQDKVVFNPLNANIIAVNYSRIANIVFIKDKR